VRSENSAFENISIEIYENGASTPKKETLYLTSVFITNIEFYKQPVNEEEIPVEKIPDFTWVLYNDMDVYFKIKFAKDTRKRGFGTVQVPSDDLIRAYYNNLNLRFEGGNGSVYPVELCPAMPLNSVISNPDIKNGDIILRLKSTEHILNHINKYIKEPDELKNTSKYSIDVYPGISQYSTDMDEFDRKSGYQFGKSRQGKLKEGQENPFSEDAFEGTGEQIAVSPNTYKCDVEIPSFDYIYNGGMLYLTLGKDILYPNEKLYRISFPNTAQWVAFSGHGISGRHAGLFFMDSDKWSDYFMLVDFDGTKAKDAQYRNIFVVDLLKNAWAGKVKILILNSCYNLNLRVTNGEYPADDLIWNDVSNIGKDNNGLKWLEMLGNDRNVLKPNTAVLGWGSCRVNGVQFGNKSTGQSPSDIVKNGSFTAPMMQEFINKVNSMSSNSAIEIANLWIDAAIKANKKENFSNEKYINTNCFNAVAIACNQTTIKAFAIEVKETTGKPKYELTKKEAWNCVIP